MTHPEHVGQLIDQRLLEVERCIVELEQARASLRQIQTRTSEIDAGDCRGYCHIFQGDS